MNSWTIYSLAMEKSNHFTVIVIVEDNDRISIVLFHLVPGTETMIQASMLQD